MVELPHDAKKWDFFVTRKQKDRKDCRGHLEDGVPDAEYIEQVRHERAMGEGDSMDSDISDEGYHAPPF